jgi:hypothetical protein
VCALLFTKGFRERMGTKARGFIERFYSLDKMLDQTEVFYQRLRAGASTDHRLDGKGRI